MSDPRGHEWVLDEEDKGSYADSYDTCICTKCGCRSIRDSRGRFDEARRDVRLFDDHFAGKLNDFTCDEVVIYKVHES